MKVVELLKVGSEMLKVMSRHDVCRDDYRYVSLYEKYHIMREKGVKHLAAIHMLSEDYHISTRTVERVVKRLGGEIAEIHDKVSKQTWLSDFSSNIAGNAVWGGAVWVASQLLRKL